MTEQRERVLQRLRFQKHAQAIRVFHMQTIFSNNTVEKNTVTAFKMTETTETEASAPAVENLPKKRAAPKKEKTPKEPERRSARAKKASAKPKEAGSPVKAVA